MESYQSYGAASPRKFLSLFKERSMPSAVLCRDVSSGPKPSVSVLAWHYASKPVRGASLSHMYPDGFPHASLKSFFT